MLRYAVEDLAAMARTAGLEPVVLDENLTYKQMRYTLELRPSKVA